MKSASDQLFFAGLAELYWPDADRKKHTLSTSYGEYGILWLMLHRGDRISMVTLRRPKRKVKNPRSISQEQYDLAAKLARSA